MTTRFFTFPLQFLYSGVGLPSPIYFQPHVLYAYHSTSMFERSALSRPKWSFKHHMRCIELVVGSYLLFIINTGGILPRDAQTGRTLARRRVHDELPEKVQDRLTTRASGQSENMSSRLKLRRGSEGDCVLFFFFFFFGSYLLCRGGVHLCYTLLSTGIGGLGGVGRRIKSL